MQLKTSKTQQLIVFFLLAFGIGWLAWIPIFLNNSYRTSAAFVFLFSPALAALITAAITGGRADLQELLGRYRIWRFHVGWYLLALLLLPGIFLVTALVTPLKTPGIWIGSPWYFVVASFGYLVFINSGEEIGWRGFALPRLQSVCKNPLVAAIVMGALWGLWHLPLYSDPQQSNFPLPLFLLFILGLSVLYSALFNQTRGSLLGAVLLHAATDIPARMLQIANFTVLSWSILVILVWACALIIYFATMRGAAGK